MCLVFLVASAHAGVDDLIKSARQKNLAREREWLLLLHYHRNIFGAFKSDIDGPDFFLSKNGRTNPEAELEATLTAFFEPVSKSTDTQHPICRYPARYQWLNEKLGFDADTPKVTCGRYLAWREKIDPASLALVFSGYYLNNPASMYGHTFLRVGRKSATADAPLLDYTVNFAAQTTSKNGLVFAVRGLMGGYSGAFSTLPYYMKVQQYNNLESRDLWEYDLNIDQKGVDRLIAHLWELGPTTFSYYFFNKNCSYQLLPVLEVADPSLHLSDQFRFRAIPADTLRAVLEQPGLVKKYRFRPSAQKRMVASRDALSSDERKLAAGWAEGQSPGLAALPTDRQRLVLNAAYDYFRYRSGYQRQQPAQIQERDQKILLALNALPSATAPSIEVPEPAAPHLSHKTGRWAVGFGANRNTGYEEVFTRGALHDLEDDPTGFVDGTQLEMMSARLRFENGRGIGYVEEATGIQVQAMTPWEDWIHKPSWKLHIRYARAHDLDQNPEGSGYAGVSGGSGLSARVPVFHDTIVYAMIDADGAVGGIFDDNYRAGGGGSAGMVTAFTHQWRAHFVASFTRYFIGNVSNANKLQLIQSCKLPRDFEIRLDLQRQNRYEEGTLALNRYF